MQQDPLEGALDVFRYNSMPRSIRRAAEYLIDVYSDLGWWESAAKIFDKSSDAADTLYRASLAHESRHVELSQNRGLLLAGAVALVQCGRAEQAIVTLERVWGSKSRPALLTWVIGCSAA
jgi:hypothetical protein